MTDRASEIVSLMRTMRGGKIGAGFDRSSLLPVFWCCGVYFLFSGEEVVYVGQSINVHARIKQHVKWIPFDDCGWLAVEQDKLLEVESYYISLLQPMYNKRRESKAVAIRQNLEKQRNARHTVRGIPIRSYGDKWAVHIRRKGFKHFEVFECFEEAKVKAEQLSYIAPPPRVRTQWPNPPAL